MKLRNFILCATVFCSGISSAASSVAHEKTYANSYAVVVSKDTANDQQWLNVAQKLSEKHHNAPIITINTLDESVAALAKIMPKYTCFVMKPEEIGMTTIVKLHRLMRALDTDPYTDTIHGIITGYNVEDALRMALATEPRVIKNAISTSGIGPERFAETLYLCANEKGFYGHKKVDGSNTRVKSDENDLTKQFLSFFNQMQPDGVFTSAHASQKNLEMPFSMGNLVSKNGQLYGKLTKGARLIDEKTGQAKNVEISGELIEMTKPKKPLLFFSPGNCLIGDINDKECMALAWMGWGQANQYIGYSTTTWFGMVGWGAVKFWESMAGLAPLNESLFFSQQNLVNKLHHFFPKAASYNFDSSKHPDFSNIIGDVIKLEPEIKGAALQRCVGMLWDRDVVAFYGDPALEVRHDIKST
ncbi:MAG: hypothetical protein ACRC37_01555, partial [Lentisphaeria bacterium]